MARKATVEVFELASTLHYQTSALFFYNHFAGTEPKDAFTTISLLLLAYPFLWKFVYPAVA
jgi:hypothetical protein